MADMGLDDTIQWYNKNAEEYAKAGAAYFDMNHIHTFANLLPKGARVLDAGCGAGRDANLLQKKAGLQVVGLDLSKGLLAVAKNHFPDITFAEGNLLALPFEENTFDGVWSNTSLLHLETYADAAQAISEMHRVLKTDGILHVVVKAQTGTHKTAVVSDKLSGHDRFFQYFKEKEITELLEANQFKMINIKEYSEVETIPQGRPEVMLIWALARKR